MEYGTLKYLRPKFKVTYGSKPYRSGWEKIFGNKRTDSGSGKDSGVEGVEGKDTPGSDSADAQRTERSPGTLPKRTQD